MKKILLTCLFLLAAINLFPQEREIDSLKTLLDKSSTDTSRIDIYLKLYSLTRFSNANDALFYAKEANKLSESANNPLLFGRTLHALGTVYTILGDYASGLYYLNQSLDVRKKNNDEVGISASLNNIANIYTEQSKYDSALFLLREALSIDIKRGDIESSGYELDNIANIYDYKDQYDSALIYRYEALSIRQKTTNKTDISTSYGNLANTYWNIANYDSALHYAFLSLKFAEESQQKNVISRQLSSIGNIFKDLENYEQAKEYYLRALKIQEETGDKQGEARTLGNIGLILDLLQNYSESILYLKKAIQINEEMQNSASLSACYTNLSGVYRSLNKWDEALDLLEKSLAIKREIGDQKGEAVAMLNIADIYVEKKRYDEALTITEKALNASRKIGAMEIVVNSFEQLSEIQNMMGRFDKAFINLKIATSLRDSIFKSSMTKQLAEMSEKYESEKKDKAIKILERDKEIQRLFRNSLIGGIVFLIALALVLYNRFLIKKKSEIILQEKNKIIEIEREKSEQLLLNVLPPSIAGRLKEDQAIIADNFAEASILFADIVGFTKLSQLIGAEELVRMLNNIFTVFDSLTEKYGLEKIKTIGDCYMVVGGLPIQNPLHCESVAEMALAMIDELEKTNQKLNYRLTVRIGINTGVVVAGVIGRKKFIYDLWGDAVNTASRMESHGEPSKIHVTDAVYEKLKGKFDFEERGEIEIKGKGLMKTYFLQGKKEN